jgi:hypothetical protein
MQPLISCGRGRFRRTAGGPGSAYPWSLLAYRGSLTGLGRQTRSSFGGSFDWRSNRHSRSGCQGGWGSGSHKTAGMKHLFSKIWSL